MRFRLLGERLFHAVISMVLLTLLVFGITRITGDPTLLLLPDTASPEQFAQLHAELGLDKPLLDQYGIFIGDLLQGNLGTSFRLEIPVADLILQRIPATLELAAAALFLIVVIGVPLGVYAANARGGWVDRLARLVAALGQSAPSFWVGFLAILVVAIWLRWLPSGGSGGLSYVILPAATMALPGIAVVTRLLRSSMIEALETDYVRFLRLKGVPERSILWKHALRNAALPALTYLGVVTAGLLTGSVIVETVFVWPGVGQLMGQAITARDFAVVQGVVLVFAIVYIVMNLIVDVLYAALNPRLRKAA